MGSFKEEDERTQVTFKGDGILGQMQVCSGNITANTVMLLYKDCFNS